VSNSLLTIDMITRQALVILKNKLVVTGNVNKQYDDQYAKSGAKIGDTLRIRLPNRNLVRRGASIQVQPVQQQYVPLTVSSQIGADFAFSSAEQAMKLDDFSRLVLEPAVSQIASQIDYEVASGVAQYIGQSVGTPGTTPSTSAVLLAGIQKLDEAAAPDAMRYCAVNPAASAALVEGQKGLFNPGSTISSQYKKGRMGSNVLGWDEISMSQSISSFTCGSRASTGCTVTTTVSTQGATTIAITTTGATDTIKKGDVFTIANVYAVNPQTRVTTGSLYQFVAASDATASGSAVTVTVQKAMYSGTSQSLAIIDTLPQSGAAVTFMGAASTAYPQNLMFQRDAIAFVTADLELPKSAEMAARENYDGISMRIAKAWDPVNDNFITRLDVLYGWAVIRPELAVRLWG